MHKKKSLLFIALLIFSFALVPAVNADTNSSLSAEQTANIIENCSSIKNTLKRVKNSDRNSRVSLGRSYQTIMTDYITPLNVRLVKNNNFDNNLANIQNSFVVTREDFNRKYIEYGQELEALIDIDCKSDPNDFYKQLETVRYKRSQVIESAKQLDSILEKHIEAVETLKESYKKDK